MTNFTDQWTGLFYSGSFEDPESRKGSRIQNPRIPEFQNSRIPESQNPAYSDHLVAVIYT